MSKATGMYFFLAYAFSWCAYVPLALQGQGWLSGVPGWLHLAAGYGPLLAAFIVTAWTRGGAGVRELLSRMTRWRIGWEWLAVAAFSPAALFGAMVLVMHLLEIVARPVRSPPRAGGDKPKTGRKSRFLSRNKADFGLPNATNCSTISPEKCSPPRGAVRIDQ